MNRHSTRNIIKVDYYEPKLRKCFKEDNTEEDVTANESDDSEENLFKPKLRKRIKGDDTEEDYAEEDDTEEDDTEEDDTEEDDTEEDVTEEDVTSNESDDSEENPFKDKLRKHIRKEKYFFAYDDAQSEDEFQTRKGKDRFSRIEDSGDEDYDPDKVSDDDSYKVGYNTKKLEEKVETKIKQNLTEYEKIAQKNREEKMSFLKSLNFDEVKESFYDAVKRLKEKRKPVKRVLARKPSEPLRKSLRVLSRKQPEPLRKGLRSAKERVDVNNEAIQKKLPEILPFEEPLQEISSYEDLI